MDAIEVLGALTFEAVQAIRFVIQRDAIDIASATASLDRAVAEQAEQWSCIPDEFGLSPVGFWRAVLAMLAVDAERAQAAAADGDRWQRRPSVAPGTLPATPLFSTFGPRRSC